MSGEFDVMVYDHYTRTTIPMSTGSYCSVRFDAIGSPDLRENVIEVSGGDGVQFGIEYYGLVNWTITGTIHSGMNKNTQGDAGDAWNAWSTLMRAWTEYPQRTITRAVVPLYVTRPGRENMVVFGRPGRIDPETERSHAGFITYSATFRQSDRRFFSSAQQSYVLQLATPYAGGFVMTGADPKSNFALPFQTTVSSPKVASFTVGGDMPTNPKFEIKGPVTNPRLTYFIPETGLQWTLLINTTIPSGAVVTVDTNLWARSISDETLGISYAGAYMSDRRLQDLTLVPGSGVIEYSGTDFTGSSTCSVLFRNAWSSV